MRLFFILVLVLCAQASQAQKTYEDFVEIFRISSRGMDLYRLDDFEGITSYISYTCGDSVFNVGSCVKSTVWVFDNDTNTVFDTIFYTGGLEERFGPYRSKRIETKERYIKMHVTSFDSLHHPYYSTDSIVIDKMKNPLARYENKVLIDQWRYDENGRLISFEKNENSPNYFEKIEFVYGANAITKSRERLLNGVKWVVREQYLFDPKTHHILRMNFLKETIRTWHSDGVVTTDSITVSEPVNPAHYVIYKRGPRKYEETEYEDGLIKKVKERYDQNNRIVSRERLINRDEVIYQAKFTYEKNRTIEEIINSDGSRERTTRYLDDNGRVAKYHTENSDPEVWEKGYYDSIGNLIKRVEFDHGKVSMFVAETKR